MTTKQVLQYDYHTDRDYIVTTFAGNGKRGFKDGKAKEAMFDNPEGICCSKDNRVYVIDDSRIRMIHNNQVITIAGKGQSGFQDGNALEAMFRSPKGICISEDGIIYVSDSYNQMIRRIHNNRVTRIAGNGQQGFKDGNALEAMFNCPEPICISNDGKIYVYDSQNNRIRMIYNNQVTTIVGNGQKDREDGNALESTFLFPSGICCSNDGRLFVADSNAIRMIHNDKVTTFSSNTADKDLPYTAFGYPEAICCSKDDRIYFNDQDDYTVRMIHNNRVVPIGGNGIEGYKDGNALFSKFAYPTGICCSEDGKIYVSDSENYTIRMIYHDPAVRSHFGFSFLLGMQNAFCDRQISFKGIVHHVHSLLVNVRCPLLLDQSYFDLIEKANISNESFESFLAFLYSNKLTTEQQQKQILATTTSIMRTIELIFLFDLLMDCKWITKELKTRLTKELIETLTTKQQVEQEQQAEQQVEHQVEQDQKDESIRKLTVELLPYVYNLKELIKTKPVKSKIKKIKISYTEQYCYNILVHELQKRRSLIAQYLIELQPHLSYEAFITIMKDMMTESSQTEVQEQDDESMVVVESDLKELCKLAFYKTKFCEKQKKQTKSKSSIPKKYLDAWTRPDFVIKLFNHEESDEHIEYHVHKLILCGRWKYFCLMIESGMKEVNDNEMTLSDDWTKSRFENLMRYIYLDDIEFYDIEDIGWLIKNRKLYGITVEKSHEEKKAKKNDFEVASGFESLYEHCMGMLDRPFTSWNCISLYKQFEDIGVESLTNKAFSYISENLLELMTTHETRNEIEEILSDPKGIRQFFDRFAKEEQRKNKQHLRG